MGEVYSFVVALLVIDTVVIAVMVVVVVYLYLLVFSSLKQFASLCSYLL